MDSPEIPARRHRSDSRKPKHHRPGQSRQSSTHAQGPTHVNPGSGGLWPTSFANVTGTKDELVQGWLNDIEALGSNPVAEGPPHYHASSSKYLLRPQSGSASRWAPRELPLSLSPSPLEDIRVAGSILQPSGPRKHKRHRASSEDSSVIRPNDESRAPRPKSNPAAEAKYYDRGKKRHDPGPVPEESGSSPAPFPPDHNFEKKARYKTRSDRYDTVKKQAASKTKKRKKTKKPAPAESRKDRKNSGHLASAKEVMDNFNSHSVLSGRITMPPSLRPGLFDKGRVSTKQIPDLTFHEMAFLKQPRRESQRSLSRRHESENKRGEREREEISAFFLHKILPDRYDVQGRKQPDVSGLSSHVSRRANISSHTLDSRHALNQPRALSKIDNNVAQVYDQIPRGENENNEASTFITWSTSQPSPGLRLLSACQTRAPSSTPVRIRDAFARSGIFDNTGIALGGKIECEGREPGVYSETGLASARPTPVNQTQGQPVHPDPAQSVRVVRYQDRGTMVEEEITGTDTHAEQALMQDRIAISLAEPSDAARLGQSVNMTSARIPVLKASVGLSETINTTSTDSHNVHTVEQGKEPEEGTSCLEAAPERPRSPKWAVIERLEAAAEDVRPLYSPPTPLTTAELSRWPPWPLAASASHSPSSSNMAPRRSFTRAPAFHDDANWLVSGPVLTPVQKYRTQVEYSTSGCSTPLEPLFDGNSRPHGPSKLQLSAVSHDLDQITSFLPTEAQSASMIAHTASTQSFGDEVQGQSVQDYITEIERALLDQPETGKGSVISISPLMKTRTTRISDVAGLDADIEHRSAASHTYVGLPDWALDPTPRNDSQRNWAAVAGLEEDEEQRFMSSFWRPNGHPI